jgi:hypothetical protein
MLRGYPQVDVKVCTPVTRHNLDDVANILSLVEEYDRSTQARVFYNVFQAFPRAMFEVEWRDLLVCDEEFRALRAALEGTADVKVNFLDHATLDRLYAMIFPDGSLVIPHGSEFCRYGQFLQITGLDAVLEQARFDSAKHLRHSKGWSKVSTS